jgi:ABC-type siderophore export system fused ATPase/permease subunit
MSIFLRFLGLSFSLTCTTYLYTSHDYALGPFIFWMVILILVCWGKTAEIDQRMHVLRQREGQHYVQLMNIINSNLTRDQEVEIKKFVQKAQDDNTKFDSHAMLVNAMLKTIAPHMEPTSSEEEAKAEAELIGGEQ